MRNIVILPVGKSRERVCGEVSHDRETEIAIGRVAAVSRPIADPIVLGMRQFQDSGLVAPVLVDSDEPGEGTAGTAEDKPRQLTDPVALVADMKKQLGRKFVDCVQEPDERKANLRKLWKLVPLRNIL